MKIHQYSMLCASIISQEAAVEALLRGRDAMKKMRDQYHRRRDFIVRRFNESACPATCRAARSTRSRMFP